MRKSAVLVIAVVLAVHVVLFVGASLSRGDADTAAPEPRHETPPSDATEVLARYTATREKLHSYILESNASYVYDILVDAKDPGREGRYDRHDLDEIRVGGERFYTKHQTWGTVYRDRPWSKQNPTWVSHIWDGERYLQNSRSTGPRRTADDEDIVVIDPGKDRSTFVSFIAAGYCGSPLLGYFRDNVRVDDILRNARDLSLRPGMSDIRGVSCYVVDAQAPQGAYTLWFAPRYGYNIAKAEVRKGPGDVAREEWVMKEGHEETVALSNVRFENIDGVWTSMEADISCSKHLSDGSFQKWTLHHTVTKFLLDPDHETLESFVPRDVRNGASVHLVGPGGELTLFTWQNGELVPRQK